MSSIKPEHWHLLPTNPRFGSLTDYSGGRVYKLCDEESVNGYRENRVDTLRETSIGQVEIHSGDDGFYITAGDVGIGLYYEKNGNLAEAGFDLLSYCASCSSEQLEQMGGEKLNDLLENMLVENEKLTVFFGIRDKMVAIANFDRRTGKGTVLCEDENLDYSKTTLIEAVYGENVLCVAFKVIDDVLYFGVMVIEEGEEIGHLTKMLSSRVLTDLNYRTFLDSKDPDRFDKLAKRIFLNAS